MFILCGLKRKERKRFLRKRFQETGSVPTVYETCEQNKIEIEDLERLFPDGYHRGAVKISGLHVIQEVLLPVKSAMGNNQREETNVEYETIIVDSGKDFVGSITLNRPQQFNTFNTPLALELDQALKALDADPEVRVILIKGAGKNFCAGIDVSELSGKTAMEFRAWIQCMENPLVTISRMAKPVIAQVQGVAAANGAGLVAAADLAIAADNARLGLTAINVGLNCVGPVVPVSRSVGRKVALEMLLYGNLIAPRRRWVKACLTRSFLWPTWKKKPMNGRRSWLRRVP